MKKPISLIIDDPAPGIHVYYHHIPDHRTRDGRPLLPTVSNELLDRFCDAADAFDLKGKFSVIPMPGNQGCITTGLNGVSGEQMTSWISTARRRLSSRFAFCPEVLTHANAVNLENGEILPMNEQEWFAAQDRRTMTPYVAEAIRLLDQVGLTPTGVTSPWSCGIEREAEYAAAISAAFEETLGKKDSWYFLHCHSHEPDILPHVRRMDNGRRIVSISATFDDGFWQSIDTPDTSEAYVSAIADRYLTEDGKNGSILEMLAGDGWPVLLTHWQSLYSNGLYTGVRALALVGQRIQRHLGDQVEWLDFTQLMERAIRELPQEETLQ